jgi:hypothetical protein
VNRSTQRSDRHRLRTLAFLAVLVCPGTVAMVASPAEASCAVEPSLREAVAAARVVFVGTVVSTSNEKREARVRVDSVWRGPALTRLVTVSGSSVTGPGTFTSVDRQYQIGQRYLFVPFGQSGQKFEDNNCSATVAYSAVVARLAPSTAATSPPSTVARPFAPPGDGSDLTPFIAGLAGAVAVVALVVLARGWRAGRGRPAPGIASEAESG